ncbi:chemotaxis protein CheB [Mucilaginibacter ginkgonis]|uniref:protein-glutamate O-methyltransferase n=1 Tax=Mucilaginibacter ginkgonis TaxID=2682091 RepID=A0A6I4IN65_9SPHI|nr:chemotaxis protein CheB [Mucilaginibacter ginkgonis]QQL51219.1 PAS domain-containing protein [Mucilaginibacter ginkgonis]
MVHKRKAVSPEISVTSKVSGSGKTVKTSSFPIIAIGGSAGSFPAFEKFFSQMPIDSGMAIVVVMHLDPSHKSELTEVMRRFTPLPVIEATDGMLVAANHVYIIPSNKDMGIHSRKLLLMKASKPQGIRQPIDYFFQSLANDQWNRAVAVVLSGMGSDGETGIRMIKENLGLTIAQDPETADYPSMPSAAIDTNLIDYVLAPEEIPLKIIQYLNHPAIAEETGEDTKMSLKTTNAMQKILMFLRSQTGNDFSLYKKSTIARRIDRRLALFQFTDYGQYADYLQDNPDEIDTLFGELLIGVTKFFRDAAAFDSLKTLIKDKLKADNGKDKFRVWIAGCSTGEEAYSVAIIIKEVIKELDLKVPPDLQIYATDLDPIALEHARSGRYRGNIVSEVSEQRLENFFTKEEEGYRVKKNLREIVVFAQQNLIKDPPFIKLDLLCCRNMLIYFTPELQKKVIPLFCYALNPAGLMFMGPAETIGGFSEMFKPADPKWKIFKRLEGSVMLSNMIEFPSHPAKQNHEKTKDEIVAPVQKKGVREIFTQALIDKILPASVLVNEKGDILYNNGNTSKFLELPRGENMINNILRLAREELRYPLTMLMQEALKTDKAVTAEVVKFNLDDQLRLVTIKAAAIKDGGEHHLLLISFEDLGLQSHNVKLAKSAASSVDIAAEELKKELIYTKQQLSSTVEGMENSIEKLRLSNEELQSANEELQSTNEESLTTKEEMQSLNEELMTVNSQYHLKAEELTRLNNDMKNLLEATEVSTLFLDNDLNILRYTPQVRILFNLIASDIGRPISHVVSNFEEPINEHDIREVIDKLAIKVSDIRTKDNEWYRVRIMPYRTLDNYISGAVLTLTLITDFKQMQSKLDMLENYAHTLTDGLSDAIIRFSDTLEVLDFNAATLKILGVKHNELKNQNGAAFFKKLWKSDEPAKLMQSAIANHSVKEATISIKNPVQTKFLLTATPFFGDINTTPIVVLKIGADV